MRRNVAGQFVGIQLNAKADGTAVTSGTTTVYVTGDAGAQATGSVGAGVCTHEGNGFWTYAPAQAETNYTQVGFTFVNTLAVNSTAQLYPQEYSEIATAVWAANPTLVRSATAQTGTANTITLDASASATNGIYDPSLIILTGGTGSGQARLITDYTGATKVAVVNRDWRVNPDNTTTFRIVAAPNLQSLNEGLAQGGAASTITLNTLASATDDIYVGQLVWLTTGTGQDQARLITAYVGATKVATVGEAWTTQPTNASGYMILPYGRSRVSSYSSGLTPPTANENADALLDRANGIETGYTLRQAMRLFASVLLARISGGGTGTETFRDINNTKNRVVSTNTAAGNRTNVTYDAS